jgi:hypothetical protein
VVCRHSAGDPNCSSNTRTEYVDRIIPDPNKPDSEKYKIARAQRVGSHLVLIVNYPNCSKCSYEGNKVMVFLNVNEVNALMWRKIDPHFRELGKYIDMSEAPSPAARFPASKEGWDDAIAYAKSKPGYGDGR